MKNFKFFIIIFSIIFEFAKNVNSLSKKMQK